MLRTRRYESCRGEASAGLSNAQRSLRILMHWVRTGLAITRSTARNTELRFAILLNIDDSIQGANRHLSYYLAKRGVCKWILYLDASRVVQRFRSVVGRPNLPILLFAVLAFVLWIASHRRFRHQLLQG